MITVDLHPIFRDNRDIELTLRKTLFLAINTGEDAVESIWGKGSGQLKRRVLTFFAQRHIKSLIANVQAAPGNEGRVVIRIKPGKPSVGAPAGPPRKPIARHEEEWEDDHDFGI